MYNQQIVYMTGLQETREATEAHELKMQKQRKDLHEMAQGRKRHSETDDTDTAATESAPTEAKKKRATKVNTRSAVVRKV